MKATLYQQAGEIVIHLSPDEYDSLTQAVKLLHFASLTGAEDDPKKIELIEGMDKALTQLIIE